MASSASGVSEQKRAIRRMIRARRDATSADARALASARITAQALARPEYAAAHTVHIFLSFQSEVDTSAIVADALASGKRVVVPVFPTDPKTMLGGLISTQDAAAFDIGVWGTRSPKHALLVSPVEIDLVFVPLSAFARVPEGIARLGYGMGHYDQFLAQLRPGVAKIGVAFELQEVAELPLEAHDVLLDTVLTE